MDERLADELSWSWTKILLGIFLVFVILVSIFGNILVCIAVGYDRKLRRLGNFFIVSLAIADLCVGALVMTFALANDLLDYWPFGPELCEIWIAFDISCSTCSIINLCAIALDRFAHIKDPMLYNRWMNRRIVAGSVAMIWAISGALSFIPIALGWHRPSLPEHSNSSAASSYFSPSVSGSSSVFTSSLSTSSLSPFSSSSSSSPVVSLTSSPTLTPESLLLGNYSPPADGHRILHRAHKLNQSLSQIIMQQQQRNIVHHASLHTPTSLMFNSEVVGVSSSVGGSGGFAEGVGGLPQCALDLTPTYAVVSSIISFYVPCIVMIYLYVKLYKICQKHVKSIKSMAKYQPVVVVDLSQTKLPPLPTSASTSGHLSSPNSQSRPHLKPKLSHQLQTSASPLTAHGHLSMVSRTHSENDVGNHHHHHHLRDGGGGGSLDGPESGRGHHYQYPQQKYQQRQQQQNQQSSGTNEHKAAITLGIIMGTFLACWMPFFCMNILAAYCKSCISPMVFKVLTWLGYFNSSLNPAIYSIFNTEFRDAFRRILVRGFLANDPDACVGRFMPFCAGREKRSSGSGPPSSSAAGGGNAQLGGNSSVRVASLSLSTPGLRPTENAGNGNNFNIGDSDNGHYCASTNGHGLSHLPPVAVSHTSSHSPSAHLHHNDDGAGTGNGTTILPDDSQNIITVSHRSPKIPHINIKIAPGNGSQEKANNSTKSDIPPTNNRSFINTNVNNLKSINHNDNKNNIKLLQQHSKPPKLQHKNIDSLQYQSFDCNDSFAASKSEFCKYSSLENVVTNFRDN